jgi:hypothetical protein
MKPFRRLLRHLLPVTLAAWLPVAIAAEAASENAVRVVLLYNFLQFSELPANGSERGPLIVCVASRDPDLLDAMERLEAHQVHGRPLSVQGFRHESPCDAIYVDSRARWQFIADKPVSPRVLTVGAYPGFINDGGMVEVDFQQNRARFDIHVAQARRGGIRFYPQLLRLARRVID